MSNKMTNGKPGVKPGQFNLKVSELREKRRQATNARYAKVRLVSEEASRDARLTLERNKDWSPLWPEDQYRRGKKS